VSHGQHAVCPLYRQINRELLFVYSENSERQLFWHRSDANLLSCSHLLYRNVVGTQHCLVTTCNAWDPTEFADHLPFLSPESVWLLCTICGTELSRVTIYISWHLTQFSDHSQSCHFCQLGDHTQFLRLNSFGWLLTFLGNSLPHFLKKNSLNTLLVAIMYLWLCCILCIWLYIYTLFVLQGFH